MLKGHCSAALAGMLHLEVAEVISGALHVTSEIL